MTKSVPSTHECNLPSRCGHIKLLQSRRSETECTWRGEGCQKGNKRPSSQRQLFPRFKRLNWSGSRIDSCNVSTDSFRPIENIHIGFFCPIVFTRRFFLSNSFYTEVFKFLHRTVQKFHFATEPYSKI